MAKLNDAIAEVKLVTSAEYPQKVTRPAYSVWTLERTKTTDFKIPTRQETLQQMMVIIDK